MGSVGGVDSVIRGVFGKSRDSGDLESGLCVGLLFA